jgi:hypothetical protein
MKELIKRVLREEVQKRFTKSNQNFERIIIKYMENVISETIRVVPPPEENYGNYGEEWCKGGNAILEVRYYLFSEDEDDVEKFVGGSLFVIEEEVEFLTKMLQVRKQYVLNVITEWYDEKYATKFGQEVGHPEFEIEETIETDSPRKCYQMINTDNLSRDEMIDYIDNQTLKKRSDLENLSDDELSSNYRSVYNTRLNSL